MAENEVRSSEDDLVMVFDSREADEAPLNDNCDEDSQDEIEMSLNDVEPRTTEGTESPDMIVIDDSTGDSESDCVSQTDSPTDSSPVTVQELLLENDKLRKEIDRLKDDIKHANNTVVGNSLIKIQFQNQKLARKYQETVEVFINNLLKNEHNLKNSCNDVEHFENGGEVAIEMYDGFCLDKKGIADHSKEGNLRKSVIYEPIVTEELGEVEDEEDPKSKDKGNTSLLKCFNCLGDHHVGQCTQPLNKARMLQNRRSLTLSGPKGMRYHNDEERLKKFKPGIISDSLKEALSMAPNTAPPYIYRMRVLGYPPGWLKEMEVKSSGLTMYDSEGNAITDDTVEDGEVDYLESKVQYDPRKFISYAGFNTPFPVGTPDEHMKYGMIPMQMHQMKAEAEKVMKAPEPKPFIRKKLTLPKPKNTSNELQVIEDMEVTEIEAGGFLPETGEEKCEFIPPLPTDPLPPPPPPEDKSADSSSQEEILNKSDVPSSLESLDSLPSEVSENSDSDIVSTPSSSKLNSKEVTPGTPIPVEFSEFKALPEPGKFSKGISEHIPFENLPDATGTFEKIRGVIGKVRCKLQEIQKASS